MVGNTPAPVTADQMNTVSVYCDDDRGVVGPPREGPRLGGGSRQGKDASGEIRPCRVVPCLLQDVVSKPLTPLSASPALPSVTLSSPDKTVVSRPFHRLCVERSYFAVPNARSIRNRRIIRTKQHYSCHKCCFSHS